MNEAAPKRQNKLQTALPNQADAECLELQGNDFNFTYGDCFAESVVTVDPALDLDEVGVPIHIAMRMTVRVLVTSFNMAELQELTGNGPKIYPGANFVAQRSGERQELSTPDINGPTLELGWAVERHLRDGDIVVMCSMRLHPVSTAGFRVKVLPGPTFRLLDLHLLGSSPYWSTTAETRMTLHVPQTAIARAEAAQHMAGEMLDESSSMPVVDIVEDCLLAWYQLTQRDAFIEKEHFFDLIMKLGSDWEGKIPAPALLVPTKGSPGQYIPLWTGKQVFNLIAPKGLNLRTTFSYGCCDIDYDRYGSRLRLNPGDTKVMVLDGMLLMGRIDQRVLGRGSSSSPSSSSLSCGLIRMTMLDRGAGATRVFVRQLQAVAHCWLLQHSSSVGFSSLLMRHRESTNKAVSIINDAKREVHQVIIRAQRGELKKQPGKTVEESMEALVTDRILDLCRDRVRQDFFEGRKTADNIKAMVASGSSKSSFISIKRILACVGQQRVSGLRIPFGFKRRTLPHFSKDDLGAESRGFVQHSFLQGLAPHEFFFHAMSERDKAIQTSRKSLDANRLLVRMSKALSGIQAACDGTGGWRVVKVEIQRRCSIFSYH